MKHTKNNYIIDANVPLIAGTPVKDIPQDQLICAQKCLKYIQNIMKNPTSNLVLDLEGRILKEYRNAFALKECPNVATEFYKWALQTAVYPQNMISLKESSPNSFLDYPDSEKLKNFDPSDSH